MIRLRVWHALSPRSRWWILAGALAALALAASGVGIGNGFTYDDVYVIQKNAVVHSLHHWWRLFAQSYWPKSWGGDGYRPLTMLAFAAEWVAGNGSAAVFHAMNIALYCATTVALFWLASAILPVAPAWIAAALFAVHPVHVEAVASTVGQSELWVALLLTVSAALYIRRRQAAPPDRFLPAWTMITIGALYAAALFAKEHAIVLPALLIVAEACVIQHGRPLRARIASLRPLVLALGLVASLYLAARSAVKGGEISGFQPFIVFQALDLSYTQRVLTMIGVVPEWIRLLVYPMRLSTEYSPPYVDVAQGPSLVQLPGLFILFGVLGLAVMFWKRRDAGAIATFGIAWFCITLLPSSNFVIPAGIILAERTLFFPSMGALIALVALGSMVAARLRAAPSNATGRGVMVFAAGAFAAILTAGIWRSADRTRVWHDNERLFSQAIVDAPESYRAHYMLGAWKFESGNQKEGEHHYRRAIQLFPYDPFMSYNLAEQYQYWGMCKAAIPLYRWAFEINPEFNRAHGRANLASCLLSADQPAAAREQVFIAMQLGGAPLKRLRLLVVKADSALASEGKRPRRSRRAPDAAESRAGDGKLRDSVQFTGANSDPSAGRKN